MEPLQRIPHGVAPMGAPTVSPARIVPPGGGVRSFEDTLRDFLGDVNAMQNAADASIERFVAGEVKDVHQVMLAVSEARTSFQLMMEIRNRTLEAYRELMRMQA